MTTDQELLPRVYEPQDPPSLGEQALAMRLTGMAYAKISRSLGVPMAYVDSIINAELEKMPQESKENLRRMELMRTDQLLHGIWQSAAQGDIASVRAATDLLKRRAAMTGIDAALKVETTDRLDAEIEKLLEELAERSQRERYAD